MGSAFSGLQTAARKTQLSLTMLRTSHDLRVPRTIAPRNVWKEDRVSDRGSSYLENTLKIINIELLKTGYTGRPLEYLSVIASQHPDHERKVLLVLNTKFERVGGETAGFEPNYNSPHLEIRAGTNALV